MAQPIKQYPDSNMTFGETFDTRLASSLVTPSSNPEEFSSFIPNDVIGLERAQILHNELAGIVMDIYPNLEMEFSETFHGVLMPAAAELISHYNDGLWEMINNRNDEGFIQPDSYYNVVLAKQVFGMSYPTEFKVFSHIPTVVEVEHQDQLSKQTKLLMDSGPSSLFNMFNLTHN